MPNEKIEIVKPPESFSECFLYYLKLKKGLA